MSESQNGLVCSLAGSLENHRTPLERLGPAPFLPRTRDLSEDKRVYNMDPGAENPR
jgi:hypothetical protein